jgi:hypothetical protein
MGKYRPSVATMLLRPVARTAQRGYILLADKTNFGEIYQKGKMAV